MPRYAAHRSFLLLWTASQRLPTFPLSPLCFPYVISIARQLQPHSPPSLVGHEIGADIGEPRRPAQRHGAGELGVEVIEHRPHAVGTVEREPPDDRQCNENR